MSLKIREVRKHQKRLALRIGIPVVILTAAVILLIPQIRAAREAAELTQGGSGLFQHSGWHPRAVIIQWSGPTVLWLPPVAQCASRSPLRRRTTIPTERTCLRTSCRNRPLRLESRHSRGSQRRRSIFIYGIGPEARLRPRGIANRQHAQASECSLSLNLHLLRSRRKSEGSVG